MSDITIKIHQGTGRLTGESLCRSCRYGQWWEDQRGEHLVCVAHQLNAPHPQGKVFECGTYYNRALPSLNDLYQTAWVLRTEKGGKMIGFAPPPRDTNGAVPPAGHEH